MHNRMFDSELVHLERVLMNAQRTAFRSTYWRGRIVQLSSHPQAASYRQRIARLTQLVAEMDGEAQRQA